MWGVKVWAESGGSSVSGEPVPPPPSPTSVEPTRKSRKKLRAVGGCSHCGFDFCGRDHIFCSAWFG